jgi:hypothetical protein
MSEALCALVAIKLSSQTHSESAMSEQPPKGMAVTAAGTRCCFERGKEHESCRAQLQATGNHVSNKAAWGGGAGGGLTVACSCLCLDVLDGISLL